MNNQKKKKKGSYGKVVGFCVAVGCVATLLAILGGGFGLGGGGFGLPFGGNGSGSNNGTTNNNGYANEPTNNDESQEDSYDYEISEDSVFEEPIELVIVVAYNRIYHNQQEVTLDELVLLLNDLNDPNFTWELIDEQAILETLENVQALMRENDIAYVLR